MLESDPDNTMVLFGLANEYLKAGDRRKGIETLERYLEIADDEGAAWGMLAKAYAEEGEPEKAREAFSKGIEVSLANGHPSMAEDYRFTLENEF